MKYKVNTTFHRDLGFQISYHEVLEAVTRLNTFLCSLPATLYRDIDFKTTGALIGAILCSDLANVISGASVNPIEKGYPDIIPTSGLGAPESVLRNYPQGLEVKGTIGNLKTGSALRAGQSRISELSGITWQAHHRDGKQLFGFVWDFINDINGFKFPAITGVFFSDELTTTDWGAISGTTGRNTKVSGMTRSGKTKMGKGWILLYDDAQYIDKYGRYLHRIE